MKRNWSYSPLGELVQMRSGGTPSRETLAFWNGTTPWFSGKDLKSFYLRDSIEHIADDAIGKGTRAVGAGALLILVRGMTLMKEVPVGVTLRRASFNQDVKALLPDPEKLDVRFLGYFLRNENHRLKNCVTTAGHGTGRLPLESLEEYPIPLPPLPEQQKIADILCAWDEALEKLAALIATKERRKQTLMQQLLTGKRRLPGFSMAWSQTWLSDVAEELSIRNRDKLDRSRLFAVTKAEGMIPMRENVQGAKVDRCQIVERGWFAYNPMRINIGSIARWEEDTPVMVSPDYVVFRTKEDRLLSDYLNHVRRAPAWSDFVGAAGNGSVRIRIWFEELGHFRFPLPAIEEQRAIANILDAADAELHLLRHQRAAFDQQKRGLMQQLLTGKLRVKI